MKKIDQLKEYIRELRADAECEINTSRSRITRVSYEGYIEALDDAMDAIEGIWDV